MMKLEKKTKCEMHYGEEVPQIIVIKKTGSIAAYLVSGENI